MVWHYQTTPGDNWDYTATQKMILTELEIEGRTRRVLMQAPKNGFFYVLDRETGELLSAEPYASVNGPAMLIRLPGDPWKRHRLNTSTPQADFPRTPGGHNWQPMSYSPDTGLVYIPVKEAGAIWTLPEEPFEYQKGGLNSHSQYIFTTPGEWGLDVHWQKPSRPSKSSLQASRTPPFADSCAPGIPSHSDWYGNRSLGALGWQYECLLEWRRVVSTGGGLVFQGRGTGDLVALDAASGATLHSIAVGASMMAAPMTYSIEGQYVAILTGIGGGNGNDYVPGMAAYTYGNQGRLVAFRLGGGEVPDARSLPELKPVWRNPRCPAAARQSRSPQARATTCNCAKCHSNIDGRGSGIPDLRLMDAATHAAFADILLQGTLVAKGMEIFRPATAL